MFWTLKKQELNLCPIWALCLHSFPCSWFGLFPDHGMTLTCVKKPFFYLFFYFISSAIFPFLPSSPFVSLIILFFAVYVSVSHFVFVFLHFQLNPFPLRLFFLCSLPFHPTSWSWGHRCLLFFFG